MTQTTNEREALRKSPFANCQFDECDLIGQCKSEGKCHHPKKQALSSQEQGQAVAEVKLDADNMKYIEWNAQHWTHILSAGNKLYLHPPKQSSAVPSGWISCADRLPIEEKPYLVFGNCTNDGYRCDIAYFMHGNFEKYIQPTYWQHLPTPPKSE